MSIGSKLKVLIDHRGTNVNRLAREAQVSPQTIYGIIKRDNTKVDINILQSLANELNVTLDYFSGTASYGTSIEEQEILLKYRKLDFYGRQAVDGLINCELARVEYASGAQSPVSIDTDDMPQVI